MSINFEMAAIDHRFTLRCFPISDQIQTITNMKYTVTPNESLSSGYDAFGNLCVAGFALNNHDKFSVDVSGTAQVGAKQEQITQDTCKVGYYKYESPMTKSNAALENYFSAFVFVPEMSNFDKAMIMMQQLFLDFSYVKGATNVTTTAGEAFELGKGVCQDYSHILIALCKLASIPARYVAGLLLEENFTHAWVEIFQLDQSNPNQGYWIAIDPTNNLIVDDHHIKFSCGRDSKDCQINHGIFTGGGNQTQVISINVSENENKIFINESEN